MQQRPDLSRFREIPAFAQWRQRDMLEQVAKDLQEHDYGRFYGSAILADEMRTDDRIAGVLATRIGGFLSVPTTFKPANPKRKAAKLAELLGGADESEDDGLWPLICSQDAARELLFWRIMLGVAVAEIVWDKTEDAWTPRIVPVHPRYLRWDWNDSCFYLYTWQPDTIVKLPETQHGPYSDGKWIVWGGLRSWMNGAVRSLGTKYLGRQWNERDWFRYNEKHGLPAAKGKVPSEANAEEKEAFRRDLNNLGSEPTVICPQPESSDHPGFDFEWVETTGSSTGGVTFQALKTAIDADIAILLLGQNLTTEMGAAGSASGSRAGAQVHDMIRIDKKREDAGLYQIVRNQCLRYWAQYTMGDPDLAPYPSAQVDPPDDELQEAQTLNTLGEAAQKLMQANPRTDIEAIWETYGIPQNEPEVVSRMEMQEAATSGSEAPGFYACDAEGNRISGPHQTKEEARDFGQRSGSVGPVVIRQQQEGSGTSDSGTPFTLTPTAQAGIITVNEARSKMGLAPWNGPDGNLTIIEFQAKHGAVTAEAVTAEDGGERPAPKVPGGFSGKRGQLAALSASSAQAKRQARYRDALASKAAARAARAMGPYVERINALVASATDPRMLKRQLLALYRNQSPAAVAKVFERANILANLAGRHDLILEL